MPTKSFDYSHTLDATRPGMQHSNSLERTTHPVSSTMNHMTSREENHVQHDTNHVSRDIPDPGTVARETGPVSHDSRMPGQPERMSGIPGMQRTDSVDTGGSQISELCYSLSQLTKGAPGTAVDAPRPPRPGSSTSSRAHLPPGSFASITLATHPTDPDCCTRVSRHVMGAYGASRNTPARYTPTSTKSRHHKHKVPTIQEKTEHRVKKSSKDPEGLESSSLKFFSKISNDKSHHKKKKKHLLGKGRGETSGQLVEGRDRQRTESR